ncbi:unnamed protein product [Protopolystoma xenopodis]|uniref:Uncharacterized protein n=1 Tax=Protopolystoma xenopodis TaxID=117903 RepID=A0A3S5A9U4_9PLAT|nr:unnamed protein product [Protopolystoma xenopodis]
MESHVTSPPLDSINLASCIRLLFHPGLKIRLRTAVHLIRVLFPDCNPGQMTTAPAVSVTSPHLSDLGRAPDGASSLSRAATASSTSPSLLLPGAIADTTTWRLDGVTDLELIELDTDNCRHTTTSLAGSKRSLYQCTTKSAAAIRQSGPSVTRFTNSTPAFDDDGYLAELSHRALRIHQAHLHSTPADGVGSTINRLHCHEADTIPNDSLACLIAFSLVDLTEESSRLQLNLTSDLTAPGLVQPICHASSTSYSHSYSGSFAVEGEEPILADDAHCQEQIAKMIGLLAADSANIAVRKAAGDQLARMMHSK